MARLDLALGLMQVIEGIWSTVSMRLVEDAFGGYEHRTLSERQVKIKKLFGSYLEATLVQVVKYRCESVASQKTQDNTFTFFISSSCFIVALFSSKGHLLRHGDGTPCIAQSNAITFQPVRNEKLTESVAGLLREISKV